MEGLRSFVVHDWLRGCEPVGSVTVIYVLLRRYGSAFMVL